jgi:hypothetical protein
VHERLATRLLAAATAAAAAVPAAAQDDPGSRQLRRVQIAVGACRGMDADREPEAFADGLPVRRGELVARLLVDLRVDAAANRPAPPLPASAQRQLEEAARLRRIRRG